MNDKNFKAKWKRFRNSFTGKAIINKRFDFGKTAWPFSRFARFTYVPFAILRFICPAPGTRPVNHVRKACYASPSASLHPPQAALRLRSPAHSAKPGGTIIMKGFHPFIASPEVYLIFYGCRQAFEGARRYFHVRISFLFDRNFP
jgi:hypothetical protein